MIRWKMNEIMARYRITGAALADELQMRQATISNLRTSRTIPRIDGEQIERLLKALSKLAGKKIRFYDMFEEEPELDSFAPGSLEQSSFAAFDFERGIIFPLKPR